MKNFIRKIYYWKSFLKFKKAGKNIMLSKGGKFLRPEEISFGNNIFINSSFHISARNLTFGNDIMIGPNLVIECDDHIFNHIGKTMFETKDKRNALSVEIENDVWIGANVTILKNVIIGEGAIVGAGSVVTKNVPPYSICVGNPCKPIRSRFSISELTDHLNIIQSNKTIQQIIAQWGNASYLLENN